MSRVEVRTNRVEDTAVVAAAQAGDQSAFSELVERYRRELQVHCYRMLGSFEESEDLVQETFLRAWRRRESYQGRSTFRAWRRLGEQLPAAGEADTQEIPAATQARVGAAGGLG